MHILIVGMTGSGKTTLAKRLASSYRRKGIAVLVLDPIGDQWDCDFNTMDPGEYISTVQRSSRCALFLDESGETVGQFNKEMFWLATRARHYGHKSHFITQRAAMLSPTVRGQCSDLFLFNSSKDDALILSKEFNKDELKKANTLEQFEYIYCSRFSGITRKKL